MSQNFHTSYVETLGKLETQYCKLKVSLSPRPRLVNFYYAHGDLGSLQIRLLPNSESTWFGSVLACFFFFNFFLDYIYCV